MLLSAMIMRFINMDELCACICIWAGRRIYIWVSKDIGYWGDTLQEMIPKEDEIKFCGEVTWSCFAWWNFCCGAHQVATTGENWQWFRTGWSLPVAKRLDDKDQLDLWAEPRARGAEHECAHPSGQPHHHYLWHLNADQELTSQAWETSYSKCHGDLKWRDFCSVMSKAWKRARVGVGFRGCKWQTHISSIFQQDQVFSMDFQRLTDHYKIFTESNRKWKVLWCSVVEKNRSRCWNEEGLFASRDTNIITLLVLGIWIQCMLCFPGQRGSLLVVSAWRRNYLALCRVVADDHWHVLQEDG